MRRLYLSRGANAVCPWWCARWIPIVSPRSIFALHFNKKSLCPKAKPFTHIALVNEITILPMHFPADARLLRSHHLPHLLLGIGLTEEERIRQRWRDFTDVLLRFGDVVVYIPKWRLLYARTVLSSRKRSRKGGAISQHRPAKTSLNVGCHPTN